MDTGMSNSQTQRRTGRRIRVRQRVGLALITITVVAATVATSRSVLAAPTATHFMPASYSLPHPGTGSELSGVYCVSSSNCWAVGSYGSGGAQLNQALHWNGTKWSSVTVPDPGGTAQNDINTLFGVRCTGAKNCWAVGYYVSGGELNQALHWNGTKWSVVGTPDPAGTATGEFNDLLDVSCASASDCWAVGEYGVLTASGEIILNQVLHWNGSGWSAATVPNPGGSANNDANALESVRCNSKGNSCWAVGTYGFVGSPTTLLNEALHWNGTTWSQIGTPNPDGTGGNAVNTLSGVTCTAASDCWAVGDYGSESSTSITLLNQALHWDGAQWTLVSTPDPDGSGTGAQNGLFGVTCTSPTYCWAAGVYGFISGGEGIVLNEAMLWNGTTWSLASTPDPGGTANGDVNELRSVRCASASLCWAVGDIQPNGGGEANQALRWDGTTWTSA
jgi:hypothetical protein